MRIRLSRTSNRTTTILILLGCFVVVVAATAHLLHSIQPAHKHGKDVADVCSVCVYCMGSARAVGYVAPRFTVLPLSHVDPGTPVLHTSELLRIQIGRAPPALIEPLPHRS